MLTSAPKILESVPKFEKTSDIEGFQYAFIGAVYMSIIKELAIPLSALEDALKERKAGTVEVEDIKRIVIEVISTFDIESLWNKYTSIKTETPTSLS